MAGDVDRKAAVPLSRVDLLDPPRRPGDAGVVDEAVEPAEDAKRVVEEPRDLQPGPTRRSSSG